MRFSAKRCAYSPRPIDASHSAMSFMQALAAHLERANMLARTRFERRSCQRQHDRAHAQKNTLQPHRRQHWVIPPKANSAFVAAMEDVLSVYTRPLDGDCLLV